MKKILLTAAIILAAVVCGNAESRTFVREYYYQAGESDSKISCLQSVKDTKFESNSQLSVMWLIIW